MTNSEMEARRILLLSELIPALASVEPVDLRMSRANRTIANALLALRKPYLGPALVAGRQAAGYTQRALASMIGVYPQTLNDWERGGADAPRHLDLAQFYASVAQQGS